MYEMHSFYAQPHTSVLMNTPTFFFGLESTRDEVLVQRQKSSVVLTSICFLQKCLIFRFPQQNVLMLKKWKYNKEKIIESTHK
jgi:hypothetical protein